MDEALKALEVFVGEWNMTSSLARDPATAPRARTTFEWLTGKRFLIQQWDDLRRPGVDAAAHASGPDFSQRFTGTFSEDGNTIAGRWEMSNDGSIWTHDFDLTYDRVI